MKFTDLLRELAKKTQNTYMALKQPPYRPPPWVFGPMWTVLYGLMGFAAYRAWTTGMQSFDPRKVQLAKVCMNTTPYTNANNHSHSKAQHFIQFSLG